MARPLVLDTDIAGDVDDALALALLLTLPDVDLVAVTVVGCDAAARAQAALSLLAVAGHPAEVCLGAEDPLLRVRRHHPVEVAHMPPGDRAVSGEPAAERIVRAAAECDGLELVTIGPLTNLARALAIDPKLPDKISRLTMMGGHFGEVRVGDRVLDVGVDYNLVQDPEATMAVLGAGFALRMIPSDITMQTWLRAVDVVRLEDRGGSMGGLLADLVRRWTPVQQAIFTHVGAPVPEENMAFLHDPLTVLSLVDTSALSFEDVSLLPTVHRGVLRTLRSPVAEAGLPASVAVGVDAALAREQVLRRLAPANGV